VEPGCADRVRVMIVDDHPVVRDGVATSLSGHRALEVVAYAESGAEAVRVAAVARPAVILLDLRLRDVLAPEIIGDLLVAAPGVRIVLFTAYPDHAAVQASVDAGAVGVLVKDARRNDLVHAVLTVARDGRLPGQAGEEHPQGNLITPREYDVLRRVAMGQSNPEIAEGMFISRNTVKSYLQNMLHKLGAHNRVEAIAKARELGLL
jgi:two-component system nitrate/nitrite response regulator NarL